MVPELGGDGGGGQLEEDDTGGGGDGVGGGGDGGGLDGTGLHGFSHAEHIVHSIWYLEPDLAGEFAIAGNKVEGKSMNRVRRDSLNIFSSVIFFFLTYRSKLNRDKQIG